MTFTLLQFVLAIIGSLCIGAALARMRKCKRCKVGDSNARSLRAERDGANKNLEDMKLQLDGFYERAQIDEKSMNDQIEAITEERNQLAVKNAKQAKEIKDNQESIAKIGNMHRDAQAEIAKLKEATPVVDEEANARFEKGWAQWTRLKPYLRTSKATKDAVNKSIAAYNRDVNEHHAAIKAGTKPKKWADQTTVVSRITSLK